MSEMYFKTYGEGDRDVLMVHGWASSHTMWEHVAPLVNNATCHAIDLPGFGETPAGDSALTIDAYADEIIRFSDTHERPQMIVAHSMGGLITLKAVSRRPDLADQLVLICPVVSGKFGAFDGSLSAIMRHDIGINALRASRKIWKTVQNAYLLSVTVPMMHDNPHLAERVKANFMKTHPDAGIEAIVSMAQEDTTEHLPDIVQDALVCVSLNDPTVPPSEGEMAASMMPNATLATFAESRHHPMDEEPEQFASVFTQYIRQFGL